MKASLIWPMWLSTGKMHHDILTMTVTSREVTWTWHPRDMNMTSPLHLGDSFLVWPTVTFSLLWKYCNMSWHLYSIEFQCTSEILDFLRQYNRTLHRQDFFVTATWHIFAKHISGLIDFSKSEKLNPALLLGLE